MASQVGKQIKAALVLIGVTQKAVAESLGVSTTLVHQVIYGKATSRRVRREISSRLGYDPWRSSSETAQAAAGPAGFPGLASVTTEK